MKYYFFAIATILLSFNVFAQVTDTGNKVGIGTGSPESKLHVQNGNVGIKSTFAIGVYEATDAQLDLISSSAGSWGSALNLIEGNGTNNTDIWSIVRRTTGGSSSLRINYGTKNDHTNTNIISIKPNGHFGIGTTTPSEQLNVYSPISGVLTRFASSANGGISGIRVQGKTNDGSDTRFLDLFFDPETYTYGLGAGTSSGQLPINSGSSQGDLVIDINGNIELKGTTTIKGNKIRFSESRGLDYEPTSDAIFYNGYNNGQVAMLSDRDGNSWFNGAMGIGTSNTFGYKLAVNGTIGSTEVKVENTSAWPDFVFEKDYNLRTLNEVEEHINENGHLPEIPSEAEVTENGIKLGEMNAKLLLKIEELTLYMIDINKQVQLLKAENKKLKSQIED